MLPIDELTELRSKIISLAYDKVRYFLHQDSGTHIYFNNDLGRLSIKGVGCFADEAYDLFSKNLISFVQAGNKNDLELWLASLQKTKDF